MPFGGLLTTGLLSAGTSIFGGITQRNAAKNAATQQVNAANDVLGFAVPRTQEAQARINAGLGNANDRLETALSDTRDVLQPYRLAGQKGTNELAAMDQFSYNPSQLTDDPGYQFRLAEGNKALNASAAARGGVLSGSTLKAAAAYNSGQASQEYQNAFNRALTSYNTNESRFKDLAGIGLSAAGTQTSANLAAAGQESGNTMSAATQDANLNMSLADLYERARTGAGNAQAAGTIGAGNATAGIFGNLGNTATQLFSQYQQQNDFDRFMKAYNQGGGGQVIH